MKTLLSVLLFVILFVPNAHGQSLAFELQPPSREYASYSSANFVNYHWHHRMGNKTIVGGIVGLSGCVVLFSGIVVYSIGSIQDYEAPPNYGMQHAGIGLMIGGAAMGITGAIIGIQGKRADKRGYGWRYLARPNKLGVAYNF
jgi:hypothetical protein